MKRKQKKTAALNDAREIQPLPDGRTKYLRIAAVLFLVVLGFSVYSNTLHSPFCFDDKYNIVDNMSIRNISDLRVIWKFYPTRFVTFFSIALNYHFGRLNVFGYHAFNLAAHIGAAVMVWWLALLTLQTPAMRDKKISGHSTAIALLSALIFVAHPVQTQAVTYITQRATSLAAFFYISAFAFYVRSRLARPGGAMAAGRVTFYAASLIFFILALFSKEMTVTLPFMIVLYELFFFREEGVRWKPVIPFFALLPVIPIILELTKFGDFEGVRLMQESGQTILPSHYILTQFKVIVTYMRLLFVPVNLNLDYDYPISKTLFDIPTFFSLVLIAVVLIAAVKMFRRYRLISFGIFWFFLALSLESGFAILPDVIFEHRLYLPMVGYALFLVCAVYDAIGKKSAKPAIALISVVIIAYSVLTYNRNAIWKDDATIWSDVIQKSPRKARPYNNRGSAVKAKMNVEQDIADFTAAIKLKPDFYEAYYNRGLAYQTKGLLDKAFFDYGKVVEIKPDHSDAYNNRGSIYRMKGYFDKAIAEHTKALNFKPDNYKAYNNRGLAYEEKGLFDQAISDYNKAIEIAPDCYDAYNNRGNTYQRKGDPVRAIADFNKALEIEPNFFRAYNNRGLTYQSKGEIDRAILDYNKAIALKPDFYEAYNNRGNAYKAKGDLKKAISDYTQGLTVNSAIGAIYYNRALAYIIEKDYPKALADLRRAASSGYKVDPALIASLENVSRKGAP